LAFLDRLIKVNLAHPNSIARSDQRAPSKDLPIALRYGEIHDSYRLIETRLLIAEMLVPTVPSIRRRTSLVRAL